MSRKKIEITKKTLTPQVVDALDPKQVTVVSIRSIKKTMIFLCFTVFLNTQLFITSASSCIQWPSQKYTFVKTTYRVPIRWQRCRIVQSCPGQVIAKTETKDKSFYEEIVEKIHLFRELKHWSPTSL